MADETQPTYSYGGENEKAFWPADDYIPVTLGAGNLPDGACRAILCDAAGKLNLTTPQGELRTNVPVQAGVNPLRALVINSPSSGSAPTAVYALY